MRRSIRLPSRRPSSPPRLAPRPPAPDPSAKHGVKPPILRQAQDEERASPAGRALTPLVLARLDRAIQCPHPELVEGRGPTKKKPSCREPSSRKPPSPPRHPKGWWTKAPTWSRRRGEERRAQRVSRSSGPA